MNPNIQNLPNQENKIDDDGNVEVYHYCNELGDPIFKTKELFKKENKFIFYPYSVNPKDGTIKSKRIQKIELIGWSEIENLPRDFKTSGKYGLKTQRAKSFFNALYNKYKDVYYYTIGINIKNTFKDGHITLNWADLQSILNEIYKERNAFDREKVFLINKNLSKINSVLQNKKRYLPAGDLKRFLNRYDSYEKVDSDDLNALSSILDIIPPDIIRTTSNFINSKEQINKVYIEDIIQKFEKLMSSSKDNEKQWQEFFEKNTWILSHLFPYEVILHEREAYIGGKTLGNDNGRIIDFLFQNGFQDNYALLEIKTHMKELLKKQVYRKPSVFAMSDDLSGGIGQCLDQKDTYMKEFGKEYKSFDPKCLLIIGMKSNLSEHQKHCFELIRSSHKNVEIVTFDEILKKLTGLKNVLNY